MKKIVIIIFSFILTYTISPLFKINNAYCKDKKNTTCAKETIFKVGIAKVSITPKIDYKWIDSNDNNLFDPENGDSLVNKDGHKELKPFWLAGFYNGRAAIGILDDLWARVIVWDDGNNKVAFVVLDVCHFMYDDVLAIRKIVKEKEWEINHIIIASTHTHSAPDFVGIAGPSLKESSVNKKYLKYVKTQIVKAIGRANDS